MDDAAYEALMARLSEAYPSQPAYTPADVRLQSGQITRQQGQDPVMLTNPRTLQQGESNPIDFDQSGGIGQLGAMINAGRLRGMLDMSAQDGMTPGYNAMGTMQLPEGYSASYRRSNEIGGLGDAQNAIMLAKQFGERNAPSPSLSAGASRSGMSGPITYDLSGSVPLTTGRNPEAAQFRLPSSREEQPMVPLTRRDQERQPSHQEVKGAATAGLSHSPRDHSTSANAGLKFNFADGGHVDAALHLLRQHFDEGGFLSSLSNLFSGPDYLSNGKEASFANMDPNSESAADFFKADRAMRLAREAQAREPDRDMPLPPRRPAPEAAPRQQIAAASPAPAPDQAFTPIRVEDLAVPAQPQFRLAAEPLIGPYDFGQRVAGRQFREAPPHLAETPGFGQSMLDGNKYADTRPEVLTSQLQKYTMPPAALVPPAPQIEINNAVSLARETIPSAADALAAVEKFQNAGIFSGNEYDKAGEILQAHNRAKFDNIPVEEALRLNRAAGPMMINQGMPREERRAAQPIAYAETPVPAPAANAIDQATGKLTARVDPNSEAERANNVWNRMLIQESGGRQFDRNGNTITSPVGALGISQVMPSTGPEAAQLAGLPWSLERLRTDPEYNHALGRAYYEAQLERFGDPTLAAAAYNGGPGRVAGALRQARETGQPWTAFLRPETQNYVRVVTRPERAEGGEVDGYDKGGIIKKALGVLAGSAPSKVVTDPAERAANLAKAMSRSAIKNTETNEPLRLYHATTQPNLEALKAGGYDPELSGPATWLSPYADKQPAFHNTGGGSNYREGANVMPVYADIQTPLVLDTPEMIDWAQTAFAGGSREFPQYLHPDWRKALVDEGYDGIVYGGPKSKEYALHDLQIGQQPHRDEEILSLFPERQLKSAIGNSGEYNMEIPRLSEARGGEVDDALHVVREHHADGEAVGPTSQQRYNATLEQLGKFEDKPPMDPAVMGQNWANAVQRFRENPVRPGEVVARAREPSARETGREWMVGDPMTSGAQFRQRMANAALGNPEGWGIGMLDFAPLLGTGLNVTDVGHQVNEGDYVGAGMSAAMAAAAPFAGKLIKPAMNAGKRALEIAQEYAPAVANVAQKAAPIAAAGAVMSPDEAQAGVLQKAINSIRAYHSSPHEFPRFDMSKIGTGEGNQAFGHGLYFAESPSVSGQGGDYWRQFFNKMKPGVEHSAAGSMFANKFDRDRAIESLLRSHEYSAARAIPGKYGEGPDVELGHKLLADQYAKAAELLKSGQIAGPRTYEVEIHADPTKFLNWDRPLREQSGYVQDAISKLNKLGGYAPSLQDAPFRPLLEDNPRGGQLVAGAREALGIKNYPTAMADVGIPGIRYLDAGSRDLGHGTSNYVVFDDNLINILRRYNAGGEVEREHHSGRGSVEDQALDVVWKHGSK